MIPFITAVLVILALLLVIVVWCCCASGKCRASRNRRMDRLFKINNAETYALQAEDGRLTRNAGIRDLSTDEWIILGEIRRELEIREKSKTA